MPPYGLALTGDVTRKQRVNGINGSSSDVPDCARQTAKPNRSSHAVADRQRWQALAGGEVGIVVDGKSLELIDLIAVARKPHVRVDVTKDASVLEMIQASVDLLSRLVSQGNTVYGVTTGLGGSADTRTRDLGDLQRALTQHQNTGVLVSSDKGLAGEPARNNLRSHALPNEVVRAAMLARCNSLMRGHSAVRLEVIEKILALLKGDFIPIIPLRGSISASGDLSPLSYIAGTLEGNPDIFVQCGQGYNSAIVSADQALKAARIGPVILGPKEGLGLLNGTAISCSAAALALHDAQHLILMTQILTAMATEALRGTVDDFAPFISATRPHSGQAEVAQNLIVFLHGSKLTLSHDTHKTGLFQDRYPLRTAPQWIGPQLEDLALARQQLAVELNSTTDNPLVDVASDRVHHGGNFQAVSVTSAMEKTRLSLQMLGKLMFAQHTELVNPQMNKSLPPNLCFDEPSLSFTFKGVDINMASYMSELGFLTNPVSSHVQSAEMHNQSVNSLALISARYTAEAAELVALMAATHLYALCQALDLQAIHAEFIARIKPALQLNWQSIFRKAYEGPMFFSNDDFDQVFEHTVAEWSRHKSLDTPMRSKETGEAACAQIVRLLTARREGLPSAINGLESVIKYKLTTVETLQNGFNGVRHEFANGDVSNTEERLGKASKMLYRFVRRDLGVPLHKGLVEQPTYNGPSLVEGVNVEKKDKRTIGTQIGIIYEALRRGEMQDVLVRCLEV